MNVLDGMDVLIISYAAPAIASSWNIGPEALGIVFSSGLAGMTIGAMLLAPLADRIGRKRMILFSGILMAFSIYATAFAQNVPVLILLRLISGIGIGSMLAITAALTSEYTPSKSKDFWVSFVISGYPIGAVISGLVAARLIPESGWQALFKLAGVVSFITLPMIVFMMAESIAFYLKAQPAGALKNVNKVLKRMGYPPLSTLPEKEHKSAVIPVNKLLSPTYRTGTLQLWSSLFLAFCVLYFLISWIPKLAESTGLSLELAIYAGTVFNGGAFLGIVTQGFFSSRFGLRQTIGVFFIASALLMFAFQFLLGSDFLLLVFGLLGFGVQGGFVGLYAAAARMYPAEFRTTGVGWAMGSGRFGGVIGPALGGVLIGMGLSIAANFMIFAIPCLAAGIVTLMVTLDRSETPVSPAS